MEEKPEISDNIHKFMWESNLKSRNSFLMILEFMNLERQKLPSLLKMMKPSGEKFYKRYCWHSKQFYEAGKVQKEIVSIGVPQKFWEVIGQEHMIDKNGEYFGDLSKAEHREL